MKEKTKEAGEMLKRIMVRAHQIAKSLEGDYQARLSLALRQAWEEERGNEMESFEWTTSKGTKVEVKMQDEKLTEFKVDGEVTKGEIGTYKEYNVVWHKDNGRRAVVIIPDNTYKEMFAKRIAEAKERARIEAEKERKRREETMKVYNAMDYNEDRDHTDLGLEF